MVCDGAMIASTVASLMMNGVCCLWQMQEEEDRRESLRKDIRIEYERQRLLDLETLTSEHSTSIVSNRSRRYRSDSSAQQRAVQEERRRRLLNSKREACRSSAIRREGDNQERDAASVGGQSVATNQAVWNPMHAATPPPNKKPTEVVPSLRKVRPSSARDTGKKSFEERRLGQFKAATIAASDMSSLFAFEDEEEDFSTAEDNEPLSFEEVPLV